MSEGGNNFRIGGFVQANALDQIKLNRAERQLKDAQALGKNDSSAGVKSSVGRHPTGPKAAEAAQQFEALLLQQMFQSMWSTVPTEGMLNGSREEGLYRDFLIEALADSSASGQGIGIKDVILREFKTLEQEPKK